MEDLKIIWHGHACFEFVCGGHSAVIDPYREVTGYPPLSLEAGEVYASHTQHDDHGYFEAVKIIPQPGKSPFRAETEDTFHDAEGGKLRGKNKITFFEAGGVRLAHLGDLGHELSDVQLEKLKGTDIIMVPVGGYYTIDGKQAARIAEQTDARLIIPMHFRRNGKGFDIVAEPELFMESLDDSFEKYVSDGCTVKIADRKAYFSIGDEMKGVSLDGKVRAAVILSC